MDFSFDALGFLVDMVGGLIQTIVDWLLAFLPNGDANIYAVIDSIGNIGPTLTFNVFYFFNLYAITACIEVFISTVLICSVVKYILRGAKIASDAVEKIPVVE